MRLTIIEKRQAIEQIQSDAHSLLEALRAECAHENYTAKYGGNTGNWSESDDSYWVDFHCPECGWSKTEYSELTGGGRNPYYYGNHKNVIR